MKKIAIVAMLSAAFAPGMLAVDVKVGEAAPKLNTTKSWNVTDGKKDISDFFGGYVHLMFFNTDSVHCQEEIPKLILQENKYGSKGFNVLAVCALSEDTVGEFMRNPKWQDINYTVVRVTEFDAYGKFGFPTVILIGPDGKIVSTAARDLINNGPQIDEYVKKLTTPSITTEKGAKAAAAFNAGEYGKAYTIAKKMVDDPEEKKKEQAQYVLDRIAEISTAVSGRLSNLVNDKEYAMLSALLKEQDKKWKGHALEAALKEQDEFLKKKEGKKELAASKTYAPLIKMWREAKDEKSREKAKAAISAFIKANEGTAACAKAQALIA